MDDKLKTQLDNVCNGGVQAINSRKMLSTGDDFDDDGCKKSERKSIELLWLNGDFADGILRVRSIATLDAEQESLIVSEIRIHRIILASFSPILGQLLSSKRVAVSDDDSHALPIWDLEAAHSSAMYDIIHWMYCQNLNHVTTTSCWLILEMAAELRIDQLVSELTDWISRHISQLASIGYDLILPLIIASMNCKLERELTVMLLDWAMSVRSDWQTKMPFQSDNIDFHRFIYIKSLLDPPKTQISQKEMARVAGFLDSLKLSGDEAIYAQSCVLGLELNMTADRDSNADLRLQIGDMQADAMDATTDLGAFEIKDDTVRAVSPYNAE